jgi:dUTP pyrophosphatase
MENPGLTDKLKVVAQVVERFVEQNLIEKEQRDENFRKLAMAFEAFVKENPFRQGFTRPATPNTAAKVSAANSLAVPVKVHDHFKGDLPKYQTAHASGFDVRAQLSEPLTVAPGQRALIPTGMSFAVPVGYELQARPRSGWAIRDGVTLLNAPGTIDADYRGEVKIIVANFGEQPVVINDQDRIAQLVLCPVYTAVLEKVETLAETSRGDGGFGSTGK